MEIVTQIPANTAKIRLLGRHSKSVQEGSNECRTLTPEGFELCKIVSPFYYTLISILSGFIPVYPEILSKSFGPPNIRCSKMLRSLITAWEITHSPHIFIDSNLNPIASLKEFEGGDWFKRQKVAGKTVPEIIKAFLRETSEEDLKNTNFFTLRRNYRWFLSIDSWASEDPFNVAFAHEVGCSLAVKDLIQNEDGLGLNECQAYLVCLTDKWEPIIAIKVAPPGTE